MPHPTLNGAILIECTTLRHVVSSAAEAGVGALFHNARVAFPIKQLLEDIGHLQPQTSITTDNFTARHFVYDNTYKKCSKSWDMQFYWLCDRVNQKQFLIQWAAGKTNLADYFTKHNPIIHHKKSRRLYNINDESLTPHPSSSVVTS